MSFFPGITGRARDRAALLEYDSRGTPAALGDSGARKFPGGREHGFFTVRARDRGFHFPDLVLEFAVRDQGVGARRSATPRADAAGRKGRGLATRFLADRDAIPNFAADRDTGRAIAGHHHP